MLKEHGYIDPEDMDVFTVVDDPQAAVKIIVDFRDAQRPAGIELPMGMKKQNNR